MRSSTAFSGSLPVTIGVARTGSAYASVGSLHLNSPYDPVREARRFADAKGMLSGEVCLILGDTLPYLRRELLVRHPHARIISVYYSEELHRAADRLGAESSIYPCWSPGSPDALDEFLRRELASVEVDGLLVLAWPPSVAAFPEEAKRASDLLRQVIRESAGGWASELGFSRSWLHNLFANYLTVDTWYAVEPHKRPVVIAAAGPSLALALPLLVHARSRFFLVSLPSSLLALRAAGIAPDLVVTVDGGFWAQTHLNLLHGRAAMPVAMPLIAARGIWRQGSLPVLLSAGSVIERDLLRGARLQAEEIRATGTVAASAYELSCRLSPEPLIFAGLDLSYEGLSEHVRPHTFDLHLAALSGRTRPLPTLSADRLLGGRPSEDERPSRSPLLTYAGWFDSLTPDRPIFRLLPSRVALRGFSPLDGRGFARLLGESPHPGGGRAVPIASSLLDERREVVDAVTTTWLRRIERAESLFAPRGDAATAEDTVEEALLRSLAPRAYLRFRKSLRGGRAPVAPRLRELLGAAKGAVDEVRGRFLP